MEEELRRKDDLKASRMWLMSSWVEIRGKLRGNLECGSAQPSLFFHIYEQYPFNLFLKKVLWMLKHFLSHILKEEVKPNKNPFYKIKSNPQIWWEQLKLISLIK